MISNINTMDRNPDEENPYEEDDGKNFTMPAPTPTPRNAYQSGPPPSYKSTNKRRLILEIFMALIMIVLLVIVLVRMNSGNKDMQNMPTISSPISAKQIRSCMDLKDGGTTTSGFYDIQPDENFKPIETYCDMETDEGGWTLVASVHEKNIKGKCDVDDRWANYDAGENLKTSWEDKRIFGKVRNCTDDDYKSKAYFSMNAKDVMIWHVLSEPSNETMKMRAKLRYRTTNNFLQTTGGNLQSLYENSYPLEIDPFYQAKNKPDSKTRAVIDGLVNVASNIKAKVPDWHSYSSNYQSGFIRDYTIYHYYGNRINLLTPTENQFGISYGTSIRLGSTQDYAMTAKADPFVFATVFENKEGSNYLEIATASFYYKANMNDEITNTITRGSFKLQYKAIRFWSSWAAGDSSTAEFNFAIYNNKDWSSVKPAFIMTMQRNTWGAAVRYIGKPSNIVIGYVLLARKNSKKISKEHCDGVANVILDAITPMTDLFQSKKSVQDALMVPVTFDKGNETYVMQMIPPSVVSSVEPGYLQFRAYDAQGYPNAVCPGVRLLRPMADRVCIGGLSESVGEHGTCGDFTGWAGKAGDSIGTDTATGHAHSHKDISSTILIFYR